MNTDIHRLLHGGTTYKIRGALFNVYNELGNGHKEAVYQRALAKEFKETGIQYEQEVNLSVNYKGDRVGIYRPDFVVDGKVIVELKAVEFMPKIYDNQLIHYLKTTGYSIGLLANFGSSKLTIKRLIWTSQR